MKQIRLSTVFLAFFIRILNSGKPSPETLVFTGLLTGADDQNRTGDLILTKDALYRLSYISNCIVVAGAGLEPTTFGL